MEAFGEAAGIEDFDHIYYLHVYFTGREEEACSALGILLKEDGPAMLRTYDPVVTSSKDRLLKEFYPAVFPDLKPHGFMGQAHLYNCEIHTALNDAGLMLGAASGVPKFTWPDNPEHLNLFLVLRLIAQHCADCDDVRRFVVQYRVSGVKGMNCTAVDARGNILGFELESENVAFREPQDGMLLETNHWQDPDLLARAAVPDHFRKPGYFNSRNRVQFFAYYRETFRRMWTFQDLIDFSFDVYEPGRLLQLEGHNISDWLTSHAFFMTNQDRRMRVYTYPLEKDRYVEAVYPVEEGHYRKVAQGGC